jgi:MYXO-CTERM domain-containing protein
MVTSMKLSSSGDLSGAGWLFVVLGIGLAGSRRRCRR